MIWMLSLGGLSFRWLDFAQFYDANSPLIDLCIYFLLFAGIAQTTIGRHFNSRGGTAVSVAVGFMLAISLVVSERSLGLNLRTLGPVAVGIFLVIIILALFIGLKSSGLDILGSFVGTYLTLYIMLLIVFPVVFDNIIQSPFGIFIHVLFFLSFGVGVFKIVGMFMPERFVSWDMMGFLRRSQRMDNSSSRMANLRQEIKAAELMRQRLEKITKAAEQTSRHILDGMFEIRQANEKGKRSPLGRYLIAKNLEKIAPQETEVFKELSYLRDVTQKLASFDFRHFEKLKAEFDMVSDKARKLAKPELYDQWKKMGVEKDLQRLEKSAVASDQNFTRAVRLMMDSLRNNRPEEALCWIDQAIACEKQIAIVLQDIKQLEKKLFSVTQHGIQDEKRKIVGEEEVS